MQTDGVLEVLSTRFAVAFWLVLVDSFFQIVINEFVDAIQVMLLVGLALASAIGLAARFWRGEWRGGW